jgi:chromosomal replication initiation ATPase DnaA
MSDRPRQLPLDLPVKTRFETEDFIASASNLGALQWVERWPDWPDHILVLSGPEGTGKSHLASLWAEKSGAAIIAASVLSLSSVPELARFHALVIEDCDRGALDEHALFHLLNSAREKGCFIVLSGRSNPSEWGLRTPDLLSRLRLAPEIRMEAVDDALLRAVLFKLFIDRQLDIDPIIVDFIQSRIERSVAAARQFVEKLDQEGLARGKRITRLLASELLRHDDPQTDGNVPDGSPRVPD